MSTPLNTPIRLNNPQDVLAAIPHLLGFTPHNSLVVNTVRDANTTPSFGMTMRTDLPPPEHNYDLAEYLLRGPLRNQGANAVLLNVIGTATPGSTESIPWTIRASDDVPHGDMVEVLREVLGAAGIAILHACWTPEISAEAGWQCYDDHNCGGRIADPKASPLAAAMTAAGAVTFESRDELRKLVAPESENLLARWTAKLDTMVEDRGAAQECATAVSKRDLDTVFIAIQRTADGYALTEDDYLEVLLALSDSRVRDIALGSMLDERASAAEQLWLTLVRKAPPPELAEVAALLAFSAYLRGEGALASVALDRIEEVRPDHQLACLLRQALEAGIPSAELAVIARDAVEDARIMLEDADGSP